MEALVVAGVALGPLTHTALDGLPTHRAHNVARWSRVTHLTLSRQAYVDERTLESLERFAKLEHVSLDGCGKRVLDKSLPRLTACRALVSINLRGCSKVMLQAARRQLSHAPASSLCWAGAATQLRAAVAAGAAT